MKSYISTIREKIGNDYLLMPSVAIILFDEKDNVLLLKHSGVNDWALPGGAIDPNEIPADAAIREMYEETGLKVELEGIIGVYGGKDFLVEYLNGDKTQYVITVFKANCKNIQTSIIDTAEVQKIVFFSKEEIDNSNMKQIVKIIIKDAFSKKFGNYQKPTLKK